MIVRDASPADIGAIRTVVTAAFGQPDEADLVDRLRGDGDSFVELVADTDAGIVGHILFSRLGIGALTPGRLAAGGALRYAPAFGI